MKNIRDDLTAIDLGLYEARDTAQNWPCYWTEKRCYNSEQSYLAEHGLKHKFDFLSLVTAARTQNVNYRLLIGSWWNAQNYVTWLEKNSLKTHNRLSQSQIKRSK